MLDEPRRVSYWAMPSESTSGWFRATIERLAVLAGTVPFGPHVTLLGAPTATAADHERVAAALEGVTPFAVRFLEVDDEDVRYRCVTLRAEPDPLVAVRERLLGAVAHDQPEPYRPHLSLLYGELPRAERRRLIGEAALPDPLPGATIDAVAVWETTADDWRAWRELDRWTL